MSSLCNLHCKMCFRNNWFEETPALMDDETVDRVKDAISIGEISTVFFGGMGEPLMHPRLCELLLHARAHGKKTELITNALLLTDDLIDRLLQSGLDMLWVSMDGFTEESYEEVRRGSMYRKVTENIARFTKKRTAQTLGITFVMMRENQSELSHINRFLDETGADLLNLSHVVPAAPLQKEDAIYTLPYPVGKMSRVGAIEAKERELDTCPFIRDSVCFIRADGEVAPCMQLLHNSYTYLYEEKRKVYAHSFGNIKKNSLSDIYGSPSYTAFREKVRIFDFPPCTECLGCEDRLENKKDCMYNDTPTCGACLWAQGYIRCP